MNTDKRRTKQRNVGVARDWWKTFFGPETGDLMFDYFVPDLAVREVDELLRRARVRPDARILDLGCGRGRHSLELAKRGYDIIGLDFSKAYISDAERARARLPTPHLLRFVRADMRDLERLITPESVDVVLSLFNSFGYFADRRDDADVLRQIAVALKPGGALVMSTISRPGVEAALPEGSTRNWMELGDRGYFLDESEYDFERARLTSRWRLVSANWRRVRRFAYEQNVYSREDLTRIVAKFGMRVESVKGSLGTGRRFRSDAWDMSLVVRKPRTATLLAGARV